MALPDEIAAELERTRRMLEGAQAGGGEMSFPMVTLSDVIKYRNEFIIGFYCSNTKVYKSIR